MLKLFVRPCVNETTIGDVYSAAIHFRFATQIYSTALNWEVNQKLIAHSFKRVLTCPSSPSPHSHPSQPFKKNSDSFCETETFHKVKH